MSADDRTLRLWPLESRHVDCSGLRAVQVGIVHGQAYRWRVFGPVGGSSLWRVTRVQIRDVNDKRDDGEPEQVATARSRSLAYDAIGDDARRLDAAARPLPQQIDWFGEGDGAP